MAASSEELTEIGLVFTEEGYESLLHKVKTGGQAVRQLATENKLLLEAQAEVAAGTARLSNELERAILRYKGSKSELIEYKAAQIGATEALSDQIKMLRKMEDHAARQAEAFKAHQQDLRNIRGLEEDFYKDELRWVKESTAAKEAAAKNMRDWMAEEQKLWNGYVADQHKDIQNDVAYRKKMQEGLTADLHKDIQADATYRKKIADGLSEDQTKDILHGVKQRQNAQVESAKLDAQVVASLQKVNDQATALAEKQAIQEIAWANKSAKERIAILEQLKQYQAKPDITQETIVNKFGHSAIADLPNLAKHQAAYSAEVAATIVAHKKLEDGQKSVSQLWKEVTFNTSQARSEMVVLAHEAVQGRFSKIPASMMVFAEYSNLSVLATSALGLSVIATAVAIAGLTIAVVKGQLEFTKINTALITTGGYTGMTTSGFYAMADSITKVHGRVGEAKEVIISLAESGRFTKEQIELIAPAVTTMAHASGEAIDKLVGQFLKLAKDPVAASKELNEQYHYLTGAVYEQIRALEAQGNKQASVDLAEREFAKASKERGDQILAQLGFIERAYNGIADAISKAIAAAKKIGAPDTTTDLLKQAIVNRDNLLAKGKTDGINAEAMAFGPLGNTRRSANEDERPVQSERSKNLQLVEEANNHIFALMRRAEREEQNAKDNAAASFMKQDAILAIDRFTATEKRNWNNRQKWEYAQSEELRQSAKINAEGLRAAGVAMDDILKANQQKLLPSGATTAQVLADAKEVNDKVIALAKERGVALVITEDRINLALKNAKDRRPDRKSEAIQEVSFVGLNKYVQDQEREVQTTRRHSDRLIQESERSYNAQKKLVEDDYAVKRDNANTNNDVRVAEIDIYVQHARNIKQLNEQRTKEEIEQLDREVEIGRLATAAIIKRATEQATKTEDGLRNKNAIIEKARDRQEELELNRNDKAGKVFSRAEDSTVQAESAMRKESISDMNKLLDANTKLLATKEKEFKQLGMTKQQIKAIEDAEDKTVAAKYRGMIATEKIAMQAKGLTTKEVAMYQERIEKLEQLLAKTERFIELNEKLGERQNDWVEGAKQGYRDYVSTVDNAFDSIRKLTVKNFQSMEDAIVKFTTNGKFDFNSLAESMIQDLIRVQLRAAMTGSMGGGNGLMGMLNKLFSGSGSSGGGENLSIPAEILQDPSMVFAAKGMAFDKATPFAKGGTFTNTIVDSPTLFKFAKGTGMMGEAGPEAIMPLTRNRAGQLGVVATMGQQQPQANSVVVNVIESPGNGGQQSRSSSNGVDVITILVDKVKSSIASDVTRGQGAVPDALSRSYGLNRVSGAY